MSIITINKDSLEMESKARLKEGVIPQYSQMCNIVSPVLNGKSGKIIDIGTFDVAMKSREIGDRDLVITKPMRPGEAFHTPQPCLSRLDKDGTPQMMSVREMAKAGVFTDSKMSSNNLITDWQTLWDALRIDISIRKTAKETIRQNFYNVLNMPDSDRSFQVDELYPWAVIFEENNGEGQSVTQGETRGGQSEALIHTIYAAGFTWTLLAELFDRSFDFDKLSEAVSIGYNAKRDDLSMAPILDFSYSGVQQTAASTVGTGRQELLYNTLSDGIDDLFTRTDPITNRNIAANSLVLLVSPIDGHHVRQVISGFTSGSIGGQDTPKNLPALSSISKIVEYDGEVIEGRAKTTTYTGVTAGTAYLAKMNRYMNVAIKRPLQVETDLTPDVKTLATEERSWYFVETQQTTGIQYFIQELTLSAW